MTGRDDVEALEVQQREVRVTWPDHLDVPVELVNMVNVQPGPDGIVLTFGLALPPVFAGEPDEVREEMLALQVVEARPIIRLVLSPGRLAELLAVCAAVLARLSDAGLIDPRTSEARET